MPRAASAKPPFLDVARQTYGFKAGGVLDKAGCTFCHLGGPPALNPYGLSVRGALQQQNARMVTSAILHSLDSQDADNDGVSNIDEIKADTLPGDASSHPAGSPAARSPAASAPVVTSQAVGQAASGEVSPFDWKALLLAKHAQHPVLIHFPIALFIASLVFDLLGKKSRNSALSAVGYYNLLGAAIMTLPSILTGLLAWQWQFGGTALRGNLLLHLISALTSSALIWLLWRLRSRQGRGAGEEPDTTYLVLALLTVALISFTGHLGGILSGVVTGG